MSIEPLNDKNYRLWNRKVQAFLTREGTWTAIDGPVQVAMASPSADVRTPAVIHTDALAKSALILNVNESQQYLIKDEDTAFQAWTRIKDTFESKVKARKIMLQRDFTNLKQESSERVDDFVARAQRLRDDLRIVGETVSEEQLLTKLMAGLRNEFDVVVEVLAGQANLDLATLTARLQVTEARCETRKPKADATAFTTCAKCGSTRHPTKHCRSVDKDGKPVVCGYCGKRGHNEDRCFQKKDHQRQQNSSGSNDQPVSLTTFAF